LDLSDASRALLRRWIDAEGLSLFTPNFRRELALIVGSPDAAALIEADCTIGNFADEPDYRDLNRAVSKLLRKKGVRLLRGKRPRPGLREFTERIASLAVAEGVPFRTGERSRLVHLLRRVAENLWHEPTPDPRDELRRISRTERRLREATALVVGRAIARGLAP